MKLFLTVFMFSASVSLVEAKPVIEWHFNHFPPAHILEGELKGQGYLDKAIQYFIERLPHYSHELKVKTYPETYEDMKEGKAVCRALLKSEKRQEFAYFSEPLHYLLSNQVILAKSSTKFVSQFVNKEGNLDFSQFSQTENIRIGLINKRVYGVPPIKGLSEYIEAHPEFIFDNEKEAMENFFNGKIDYFVGYPNEVAYHLKVAGLENYFRFFSIQGLRPFMRGYWGCTKTKLGERIIRDINAIIAGDGENYPWMAFYEDWLTEKNIGKVRKFMKIEKLISENNNQLP